MQSETHVFRKVGTDLGGREVVEADWPTDLYHAVEAFIKFCEERQVICALLWNGIATLWYPGMTPYEWLVANEIRRTSYQSGRWPKQLVPFSAEVDPFKITPASEPASG